MEETFLLKAIETGIVGGAFIYLLWFVTTLLKGSITAIADTLKEVSTTMSKMDIRMSHMESRIERLEKGGEHV